MAAWAASASLDRILALPMSRPFIDLRSDTVTQPTPAMRRAMAEAELGDDVFGDDPTVIALEQRAAELTGKEAGLFVPSGTMANLVSLMVHVPRGGEIIAGEGAHSFAHEAANFAVVVGAAMRLLPWDEHGQMDTALIASSFRDESDVHDPPTSLVLLENSHSNSMAQPLPPAYVREVASVAHDRGVPLHVDGARIFNAAVALGVPVSELLAPADSANFCLSKGLACPVGSIVVGPRDFIWRARRARKLLGGGMRQVGVLAAPGLLALADGPAGMIERLAEDHVNARRLADGLADMPGIVDLDPARVRTNFVFFALSRPELRERLIDEMERAGVGMIIYPHSPWIRAVTHYGISAPDIDQAIERVHSALVAVGLAPTVAAGVAHG